MGKPEATEEEPKKVPWWRYDPDHPREYKAFGCMGMITLTSFICLFLVGWLYPYIAMTRNESGLRSLYEALQSFSIFGLMFFALSVPLVVVHTAIRLELLVSSPMRGDKRKAAVSLLSLAPGFALLALFLAFPKLPDGQDAAHAVVAENRNRVVSALAAFYQDHDAYPEDLDALVPEYLERVPDPGVLACDRWVYRIDDPNDEPARRYYLWAPITVFFLDFDHFEYRADKDYPASYHVIDGWAYFDD